MLGLALAVLLGSPGLGLLLDVGVERRAEFERLERRPPSDAPEVELRTRSLRRLPRRFESWFDDHFAFRRTLIASVQRTRYALGVSPRPDMVILGRDGWLFLRAYRARPVDVLQQYRGLDLFTVAQLDRFLDGLEARARWLARRGIPFHVVIAPSKIGMYDEHLPDHLRRSEGQLTRMRQFTRGAAVRGIAQIDVEPALRAAKPSGALYFRADSHWNRRGAYVAYREIVERLRESWRSSRPLVAAEVRGFRVEPVGSDLKDLAIAIGIGDGYEDERPEPRFERRDRISVAGLDGTERWDEQRVYEHEQIRVATNESLPDAPHALILRDSFTNFAAPYFNRTFHRTVYAQHGLYHRGEHELGIELEWLVDRYPPDVVIFEVLESFLSLELPRYPNLALSRLSDRELAGVFASLEPVDRPAPSGARHGAVRAVQLEQASDRRRTLASSNRAHPLLELQAPSPRSLALRLTLAADRFGQVELSYGSLSSDGETQTHRLWMPVRAGEQVLHVDLGVAGVFGVIGLRPRTADAVLHIDGLDVREIDETVRTKVLGRAR